MNVQAIRTALIFMRVLLNQSERNSVEESEKFAKKHGVSARTWKQSNDDVLGTIDLVLTLLDEK